MRARLKACRMPPSEPFLRRMLQSIQTFTLPQAWGLLAVAIVFEVIGTTCLRLANGFTQWVPSVLMFTCYALAFVCNAFVVKTLDLGITYAVWSGVGTVATAIIGFVMFREPATALKLVCIGLIVVGVLGLHTASRLQAAA